MNKFIRPYARLICMLLVALPLAFAGCGDKDNKQDDPAPPKDVKVVMTGLNAGFAATIGGIVTLEKNGREVTSYEIEQSNQATENFVEFNKGEFINIKMIFEGITRPGRIPNNTSITTEVFVDGASVKRIVLDNTTMTYNSTGIISVEDRFTL